MSKQFTMTDVEAFIEKDDVASLIAALKSDDKNVVWASAQALRDLKATEAGDVLARLLIDHDSQYVRRAAAEALGAIGERSTVEALVEALKNDEDEYVRRTALESIELMGDVEDWTVVRDALADPFADVRRAAVHMLGDCDETWAVNRVVEKLGDYDQSVRIMASKTLPAMGDAALEPVLAALGHGQWVVRQFAAWTLLEMKDERTVEALIKALHDKEAVVREVAARALGAIGDPRGAEALRTAAQEDFDRDVRKTARTAHRQMS